MEPPTTPARGEAGFALTELLVVMALLTVALGAILGVVQQTVRLSHEDQERAHAIREAQVQLDTVVREARQAFRVNPSTATRLDVSVHRGGQTRRVVFDCGVAHPTRPGLRRCTRHEVLSGGTTTPAQTVVDRVQNTTVFAYTPPTGPTNHVGVTIEVPASGERAEGRRHSVRFNDGFAVRNRGLVP